MTTKQKPKVDIIESAAGHWSVYSDGIKVDDAVFRSSSHAREFCREQNWQVDCIQLWKPFR